jgi:DNA-binding IclR family transcriptional regulator
VSAAERLLGLLGLCTEARPAFTAEEAAAATGVSLATAYRDVAALERAGLLVAVGQGRFGLGPAIVQHERTLRATDPLLAAARAPFAWLAEQVGPRGALVLCRRYGVSVLCIRDWRGREATGVIAAYERGLPMPLFRGAASRAILMQLPPRDLARLHASHGAEIAEAGLGATLAGFRARLRAERARGVAIAQGELESGVTGLAVPLRAGSQVAGSLAIALTGDTPPVPRAIALLQAAQAEAEAALARDMAWA